MCVNRVLDHIHPLPLDPSWSTPASHWVSSSQIVINKIFFPLVFLPDCCSVLSWLISHDFLCLLFSLSCSHNLFASAKLGKSCTWELQALLLVTLHTGKGMMPELCLCSWHPLAGAPSCPCLALRPSAPSCHSAPWQPPESSEHGQMFQSPLSLPREM